MYSSLNTGQNLGNSIVCLFMHFIIIESNSYGKKNTVNFRM